MQVIEFAKFGDSSQLHLSNRPQPRADLSNAVVRVESASVNPSDTKNIAGRMPQTTLPRVPGRDYSGVVVEGPQEWIDREVWGTGGDVGFTRDGTHAQYLQVPMAGLAAKPHALSHDEAGAVGVTFVTAWCAIVEYAQLKAGETLAIIGASGGVGGAATQIAKRLGARVVAMDRTLPPAESWKARLPDLCLDCNDPDMLPHFRAFSRGRGADVVLNAAGGPMFEVGLKLLARRGRQIEITSPTERRTSFDLVDFYHNESQLLGLDSLKRDLTASARVLEKLTEGFEAHTYLPPVIAQTLPLSRATEAYELVGRGAKGRIILKPHWKDGHLEAKPA